MAKWEGKAGPPVRLRVLSHAWSQCGCDYEAYQEINAVITDDKNRNLLPPKAFLSSYHAAGKWHKIPGYNSMSPILELSV